MLEPDVVEFVRRHNQVFLLTHRGDGWPTGYPMVGNYRDDGIEFSTYRASAKVERVMREGGASCLVVPRSGTADERCLWIQGPAAIREDTSASEPPSGVQNSGAGAASLVVPTDVVAKVARRLQEGKRCLLRVEIDETRWIEWKSSAR